MKLSTWIVSFCLCLVSIVFPRDSFTSFSCSLQFPYSNFSSILNLLFLCHFGWGASFRPQFILSVSLPPFPFLALAGTGTGSSCPRLSRQGKGRGSWCAAAAALKQTTHFWDAAMFLPNYSWRCTFSIVPCAKSAVFCGSLFLHSFYQRNFSLIKIPFSLGLRFPKW